jgi:hypothetical protein
MIPRLSTGCSPKASITSQMLADMLKAIDDLNVFHPSNGSRPFLLLDGHHSRLEPQVDCLYQSYIWSTLLAGCRCRADEW